MLCLHLSTVHLCIVKKYCLVICMNFQWHLSLGEFYNPCWAKEGLCSWFSIRAGNWGFTGSCPLPVLQYWVLEFCVVVWPAWPFPLKFFGSSALSRDFEMLQIYLWFTGLALVATATRLVYYARCDTVLTIFILTLTALGVVPTLLCARSFSCLTKPGVDFVAARLVILPGDKVSFTCMCMWQAVQVCSLYTKWPSPPPGLALLGNLPNCI